MVSNWQKGQQQNCLSHTVLSKWWSDIVAMPPLPMNCPPWCICCWQSTAMHAERCWTRQPAAMGETHTAFSSLSVTSTHITASRNLTSQLIPTWSCLGLQLERLTRWPKVSRSSIYHQTVQQIWLLTIHSWYTVGNLLVMPLHVTHQWRLSAIHQKLYKPYQCNHHCHRKKRPIKVFPLSFIFDWISHCL